MFAMYDDDGLNFRSTIDHLYNLHEVTESHRIHNDKQKKKKQNQQNFNKQFYKGKITQDAKDKYMQVTNLDIQHEIYHVDEIMSTRVVTIQDTATVYECYEIMKEHSVQQLPILADSQLHLKGIVTIQDITKYIFNDMETAKHNIHKTIADISTKKIITTDPISDIRRVSKVMMDFNINAMPVVNNEDILVGMVSRADIVKAVATIPHMQIWA